MANAVFESWFGRFARNNPYKKCSSVPLQARSGPEGSRKLRFSYYITAAQDGGKVVSLTHRPPLPPGNIPGTHFCYRLSRPRAIVTPSGIEPATFRFVAQHLNHCATAVPPPYKKEFYICRRSANLRPNPT